MEKEDDPYDFDGSLFEGDESRRYCTIVEKVNKVAKDDEARMMVEVPVLMSKVTLRQVARMVAEVEEKKQTVGAPAQTVIGTLEKFERLIKERNEHEANLNWNLRSQTFAAAIIDEVKEIVHAEVKRFLATAEKSIQTEVKKYLAAIQK